MFKKIFIILMIGFCSIAQSKEPIQIVVSVAPGGGTDILARIVAESVTRQGNPAVVINRPGADRVIATNHVATSKPDGKTVLFGGMSDTVLLPLFNPPGLQFNENSLVPITYFASMPFIVTVRNNFPANNVPELIETIKKNPSKYLVGVTGKASEIPAIEIFKTVGATPTIIPYKGDAQMAADLIGGHIDIGIILISSVKNLIKDNKIKPIAVLGENRDLDLPTITTMKEYNGIVAVTWWGIFAPPNTDEDTIKELHNIFHDAAQDIELQKRVSAQRYTMRSMSQESFVRFYRQQIRFYKPLINQIK